MSDQPYDVFLDARGLACPLPLVKARQALMVVDPGATVCVLATDPGSIADFEQFCDATGHELVRRDQQDGVYLHVIRKAAARAHQDPLSMDPGSESPGSG